MGIKKMGNYRKISAKRDENIVANGWKSTAVALGGRSTAVAIGEKATAVCSNFESTAVVAKARFSHEGGYAAIVTGENSRAIAADSDAVACALGINCKAKGALGAAIVLVERDYDTWTSDITLEELDEDGCPLEICPIVGVKAFIVDGTTIKADTYYTLFNGEVVEVEDE